MFPFPLVYVGGPRALLPVPPDEPSTPAADTGTTGGNNGNASSRAPHPVWGRPPVDRTAGARGDRRSDDTAHRPRVMAPWAAAVLDGAVTDAVCYGVALLKDDVAVLERAGTRQQSVAQYSDAMAHAFRVFDAAHALVLSSPTAQRALYSSRYAYM